MKSSIGISGISIIFMAIAPTVAHAESYVGLSAGVGFDQRMNHGKGNENTNYPDPPDNTDPTTSLYSGAHFTKLKLQNSPMVGVKAGHWFDQLPFIGVEAEAFYNQPNFKRQSVTLSHPGFVGAVGSSSFTEDQLRIHADQYVFALNGMYRYQGWQSISVTPYIGGGPALYLWDIHGTGFSGIIPALGAPGVDGPNVNEHPVTWGTNFKAGAEYAFTQQWAVGLEYRFNWSAMKIDNFRSISDASADYFGHAAELTLTRHF